jgi:hypothetical protein
VARLMKVPRPAMSEAAKPGSRMVGRVGIEPTTL